MIVTGLDFIIPALKAFQLNYLLIQILILYSMLSLNYNLFQVNVVAAVMRTSNIKISDARDTLMTKCTSITDVNIYIEALLLATNFKPN